MPATASCVHEHSLDPNFGKHAGKDQDGGAVLQQSSNMRKEEGLSE